MVKIRVLNEKGQLLIFDLENDQLAWSMISRVKLHHFDIMAWPKTLLKINWMDSKFSINWSKSQLYTEKSNFDFLVKIQCQRSQFIKTCQKYETYSSRNQKFKISFWNVKVLELRNFSKCLKLHVFFHNFKPIFHHDARGFRRNFQHESWRSPWYLKNFFTQLLLKILESQVIIS